MIYEKVDLYEYFHVERNGAKGGFLNCIVRTASKEIRPKLRPAMLVIPGGGYSIVSDREGESVAISYMAAGFATFILTYSVYTAYPAPLNEACMAVAYIRENAEKFYVNKEKIAAVGFSAGGHLVGLLATAKEEERKAILGEKADLVKLNAVIESYAVITMQDGITHDGTRYNISGDGKVDLSLLSIEKRVDSESAPAFIWHTSEDNCVPVENSFLLAQAYQKAKVGYALHIFQKGYHGLSVCSCEVNNQTPGELAYTDNGVWVDLSVTWLRENGFVVTVAD